VAITGAAGTIGSVLMGGLSGHTLTPLDLPECDLRVADLRRAFKRQSVVVHLAWMTLLDNWFTKTFHPDNALMAFRVFDAAAAAGVKRVIMASSVHADRYRTWEGPGLLEPGMIPTPDSPYGAAKVFVESLGRYYATERALEVICLRFGGVLAPGRSVEALDPIEYSVLLRRDDCIDLVQRCIDVPRLPGRYALFYGVSRTANPRVDTVNPIAWSPRPHA
jgi:uronate dehydrogenase